MLAAEIEATESKIRELEDRYRRELSETAEAYETAPPGAEPQAFRSAAKVAAYLTSVEIEKEKHRLIEQLYARVRELEKQTARG
jgi:hypothetical protein